jgi:hypothetical protein
LVGRVRAYRGRDGGFERQSEPARTFQVAAQRRTAGPALCCSARNDGPFSGRQGKKVRARRCGVRLEAQPALALPRHRPRPDGCGAPARKTPGHGRLRERAAGFPGVPAQAQGPRPHRQSRTQPRTASSPARPARLEIHGRARPSPPIQACLAHAQLRPAARAHAFVRRFGDDKAPSLADGSVWRVIEKPRLRPPPAKAKIVRSRSPPRR